uniref:Endonuclease-reverse transcriptase HmRTE-e01 n=1 Tax=Solanum tuberosum TaxID=4113 RepID=M1AQR1_SOLTU
MVIANLSFQKRAEHLVTFYSGVTKTHIDNLLLRRSDKGICKECKVIQSENLTTQHKLKVMDLHIKMKRKKRIVYGQPRFKWEGLTIPNVRELGKKLMAMRAWESSRVANRCGLGQSAAFLEG